MPDWGALENLQAPDIAPVRTAETEKTLYNWTFADMLPELTEVARVRKLGWNGYQASNWMGSNGPWLLAGAAGILMLVLVSRR